MAQEKRRGDMGGRDRYLGVGEHDGGGIEQSGGAQSRRNRQVRVARVREAGRGREVVVSGVRGRRARHLRGGLAGLVADVGGGAPGCQPLRKAASGRIAAHAIHGRCLLVLRGGVGGA